MTSAMGSQSEAQREHREQPLESSLAASVTAHHDCQGSTEFPAQIPSELPNPSKLAPTTRSSQSDHEQVAQTSTARDTNSSQNISSVVSAVIDARPAEATVDRTASTQGSGPAAEVERNKSEGDSDDTESDQGVRNAPAVTPTAAPAVSDAAKIATPASTSRAPRLSVSVRDFSYGRILGIGSFSKVVLATYKGDGKEYALKIMSKQHIMRERKVRGVKRERMILDQLEYPGVVRMHFTFQDQNSLYMAMECCHGGDLFDQIRIQERVPKAAAQFYAAEMVCTLEYIHSRGIVHRDLKPENLLLTADGHLRLADFGSATLVPSAARFCQPGVQPVVLPLEDCASEERNGSFVGTAEYISPEVLSSQPATPESDLWALGCIIFHMLEGRPPFHGASEYLTFQNVLKCEYKFSTTPVAEGRGTDADSTHASSTDANSTAASSRSTDARDAECTEGTASTDTKSTLAYVDQATRDIIGALLKLEPSERLGSISKGGYGALKSHEFFAGVDWTSRLWSMEAPGLAEEEEESSGEADGESEEEEGSEEEEMDEEWKVAHLGGSMLRLRC